MRSEGFLFITKFMFLKTPNSIDAGEFQLDEFQKDIVGYIAGFILRKLSNQKLVFMKDIEPLKDPSNTCNSDLIILKTRGKLIIPNQILVEVCEEVGKTSQSA